MKKSILVCLISLIAVTAGFSQSDNVKGNLGHIGYDPLPVYDIALFSESLQREMHINVVLPRGYEDSGLDYPVLYLCHGFTSNYHEFVHVGVPEYLNRFDMMVVMVDVGNSSYANWAESENGKPLNFADHVCKDVIGYVDKNYRTIADRKGRAINGISMGAIGAITMGLTYPHLFCSIGGHSAAVLTRLVSAYIHLSAPRHIPRRRPHLWLLPPPQTYLPDSAPPLSPLYARQRLPQRLPAFSPWP